MKNKFFYEVIRLNGEVRLLGPLKHIEKVNCGTIKYCQKIFDEVISVFTKNEVLESNKII